MSRRGTWRRTGTGRDSTGNGGPIDGDEPTLGNQTVNVNMAQLTQLIDRAVATAVMNQNARQVDNQQNQGPPAETEEDRYRKVQFQFKKLNPKEFSGKSDNPMIAHEWKDDMVKIFRAIGPSCTEVFKQGLATFELTGDAHTWWTSASRGLDHATMTWKDFILMFDDKYFPQSIRNAKEREFLSFKQGTSSVAEYEIEYSRLSMFRHIVANHMIDTYVSPVECAREIEKDFLAHKWDEEYLKKDNKVDRASKVSSGQHGSGKNQHTQNVTQKGDHPGKKRKGYWNQGNRGQKNGGNEGEVVEAEGEALAAKPINFYGFCYNCRERGHKASECTKEKVQTTDIREKPNTGVANRNVQPRGQGQLFVVQPSEMENATLGGTFFILGEPVSILFDTGATHSFISAKLVRMVNISMKVCDIPLCVSTPTSSMVELSNKVDACPIMIGDVEHLADLYVLEMVPYDVILGMDWLSSNFVQLDCADKTITFENTGQSKVMVQTTSRSLFVEAFLSHNEGRVVDNESLHIASITLVSDFGDLFREVPVLPPSRQVEFCIEL
ncbi:uncharacterized protein LOC113272078 [Papaver somniferum]|uniref:uncharacterized protein LOC113272078 n=1 Tax=Papaver somniferum TaxID=3469 RepID=UPI000E7025A4|nr:uncharacterized protein LOC113272078 [Papaver somniferum]